ncbi:discoidin domain-containing protein, partial [Croceitalea sp. P059]|uniref:galactose-binding domain-containing protein n=1 Tax=Croceitalea sp. P059 TaxID=3075601 RepID=UPI00288443BA
GSDIASKANDGVFNNSDNFQHTSNIDSSPWWEVDLETVSYVEDIHIYNRTNVSQAVEERLRDFYVLTSITPIPENGDIMEMIKNPSYTATFYGGNVNTEAVIKIDEMARYVRIHFPENGGNRILHAQEIEVLGCTEII